MVSYEELTNAGIDIEALLKRLMGNSSLVRVFIKKFTEDDTYRKLIASFEVKDMKAAEMSSHTLKGMCGNLSLIKLYELFTEQVNLIRSGDYKKAEAMMGSISAEFENALSNMIEWLDKA